MNIPPDEHDLHAYVDGRLDADARTAVERWLALHPARAEQVRRWRQDAQQLRAALDSVPTPAPTRTLDPAVLRARR
ncbi:anti-sigma factor family protein, partial [Burkholderia pseudomallei]